MSNKNIGPWQHCDTCKHNTPHYWNEVNILRCNVCSKDTAIPMRPAIEPIKGAEHLDKEHTEVLAKILSTEPKVEAPKEAPKAKPILAGTVGFIPDLPAMGHEIKATPLEEPIVPTGKGILVKEPEFEDKSVDTEEYNNEPNIKEVPAPTKGWGSGGW